MRRSEVVVVVNLSFSLTTTSASPSAAAAPPLLLLRLPRCFQTMTSLSETEEEEKLEAVSLADAGGAEGRQTKTKTWMKQQFLQPQPLQRGAVGSSSRSTFNTFELEIPKCKRLCYYRTAYRVEKC